MLKVVESKKVIEYKGEQINLFEPDAESRTDFELALAGKDKDSKNLLKIMKDYLGLMGMPKKSLKGITLTSMTEIFTYVHGVAKK